MTVLSFYVLNTILNFYWYKTLLNVNLDLLDFKKKSLNDHSFIIKQIKIWNTLYTNYKQYIESGKAYLIKYEKLIQEPESVLENLIKEFNLKRKFKDSFELEKKYLMQIQMYP